MPYGAFFPRSSGFGSFYQPSAPGLRFEDLYRPTPRPSYPGEPEWIDEPGELGDPDRRLLRRNAMLLAAQALAGNSGEIGAGLAEAAQRSTGFREHLIERARGEQEERYRAERAQAEREVEERRFEIAEEERADRVRQMLRLRDEIASADPALARRAETALGLGDVAGLRKLQEEIPTRQAMRAMGLEPDNPFAADETRARIQTRELEARREAELADLPRELGMRSFYDLQERQKMRDLGLLWEPNEPDKPPRPLAPQFRPDAYGRGKPGIFDPNTGTLTPMEPEGGPPPPAPWYAQPTAKPPGPQRLVPKGARGPVPPRTVTESAGAPMGPGGSVGKAKPPAARKVAGLAKPGGSAPAGAVELVVRDLDTMTEGAILTELQKDFPPEEAARILAAAKAKKSPNAVRANRRPFERNYEAETHAGGVQDRDPDQTRNPRWVRDDEAKQAKNALMETVESAAKGHPDLELELAGTLEAHGEPWLREYLTLNGYRPALVDHLVGVAKATRLPATAAGRLAALQSKRNHAKVAAMREEGLSDDDIARILGLMPPKARRVSWSRGFAEWEP